MKLRRSKLNCCPNLYLTFLMSSIKRSLKMKRLLKIIFAIVGVFIFIIVATAFSVNEIDGLGGLAGGTLLAAFGAYGAIAFAQGKIELAAFCGVIIGALLAFFVKDYGYLILGLATGTGLIIPAIIAQKNYSNQEKSYE